jgi:hypothetical protein
MDDHGRVAMNIIYKDYHDYLKERGEYNPNTMKLTADILNSAWEYEYESGEDDEDTNKKLEVLNAKCPILLDTQKDKIRELGSKLTDEEKAYNAEMQELRADIERLNATRQRKKYVYKNFDEYIRRKNNLSFYYG